MTNIIIASVLSIIAIVWCLYALKERKKRKYLEGIIFQLMMKSHTRNIKELMNNANKER